MNGLSGYGGLSPTDPRSRLALALLSGQLGSYVPPEDQPVGTFANDAQLSQFNGMSQPQKDGVLSRVMGGQPMDRALNIPPQPRPDQGILSPGGFRAFQEGRLGADQTFRPGQGTKFAQDMTPEQLAQALSAMDDATRAQFLAAAGLGGNVRGLTTEEGRAVSTPKGGEGAAYIPDPNNPNNPAGIREVYVPSEVRDATSARRAGNAEVTTRIVDNALDYTLQALDTGGGGMWGTIERVAPWTDSAEVYRQIEPLRSQARISNLQAMREASPTGGALGAVSDSEGKMLENASGALDPRSPHFERDLLNYARTLYGVVHGPQAGDEMFFSRYGERAAPLGIAPSDISAEDRAFLKSLGIN